MFGAKIKVILGSIFVIIFFLGVVFLNDFFGKPSVRVDLSRNNVIKEVQKLGSLETASFSIEKVVEAGQQGNPFQDILFGDRILLIANGKVTAGVDLYTIKESDIKVQGKELSITLPAPRILSSTLDNSKTKVYDRTQGLLNRGNKDLETKARQAAEASITKAACDGGILDEARTNVIERIKQLFEFAGFSSVEVAVPVGSC
jgi:hypothetical protein